MRGISLLYDLSGGCDHEHTCGECKYFEEVKKSKGFTNRQKRMVESGTGFCYKHLLRVPEWKASYMACKWWKSPYKKTMVKSKEKQCDGQLDLDMFL